MNTIKQQFDACVCLPLFELPMINNEWLLVDLSYNEIGIVFCFDTDNLPVWFDGCIIKYENNNNLFVLPYDEYFDNLDYYLEQIYCNVVDGFLIPNKLYTND